MGGQTLSISLSSRIRSAEVKTRSGSWGSMLFLAIQLSECLTRADWRFVGERNLEIWTSVGSDYISACCVKTNLISNSAISEHPNAISSFPSSNQLHSPPSNSNATLFLIIQPAPELGKTHCSHLVFSLFSGYAPILLI